MAHNTTLWNLTSFLYQEGQGPGNDVSAFESLKDKQRRDQTIIETFNSTPVNKSYYFLTINGAGRVRGSLVETKTYARPVPMVPAAFKGSKLSIDRIYYINLDKNHYRRAIMENWLSKQPIPYQRVSAMQGDSDVCVTKKQGPPCIGISGLVRSNLHIMDHLNTTGITLVIEDDFVVNDMEKLLASVNLVPPDWDVLRWDCWGMPLPHFQHFNFSFKTTLSNDSACFENKEKKKCWYCGGTHITMWRGEETVRKLREVWGAKPHKDIDCQLSSERSWEHSLNSYCINVGVGVSHRPVSEGSDILKVD